MPEKKTKLRYEKKLVEVPPELVEDFSPSASSPEQQLPDSQIQTEKSEPVSTAVQASDWQPNEQSLPIAQSTLSSPKSYLIKGALFTVISLELFFLPFELTGKWFFPSLDLPYVRTTVMMLIIWNLIGAALFAQARTRLTKILAIVLFGLPLAAGCWLILIVKALALLLIGRYPGF